MQLHFIELPESQEDQPILESEPDKIVEEETPLISLFLLNELKVLNQCKLGDTVARNKSRSAHDFLDLEVVKKLGWQSDYTEVLWVEVLEEKKN